MKYYGIHQESVQLLSSYLSGRTQHTFSEGKLSGALNVKHGVPQGSILGPLLFLIYINDIESSTDENLVLFADDTTAITKIKDLELLLARMKQILVNLERWFNTNRLSLNVNKTEQTIFSLRNVSPQLQDENLSDSVKFLGVYLDGTLVLN